MNELKWSVLALLSTACCGVVGGIIVFGAMVNESWVRTYSMVLVLVFGVCLILTCSYIGMGMYRLYNPVIR